MDTRGLFFVAVICVFLTPVIGRTQTASRPQSTMSDAEVAQTEVLKLEEAGRMKVVNGDNNWDDFIAPGAYMIGPDGKVMIYEKGKGFPPFPVKDFKLSEMIARAYGEVVVVTGLGEIKAQTPDQKTITFQMRFINVWRKFPEGWKMIVTGRTGVKGSI